MQPTRSGAEHELCKRLRRGDRLAAEELFQTHGDDLYEYVHWRVGRDQNLAEDVVQASFLIALQRIHDFDGRSSLYSWLCGIAKNKAREARRQLRPRLFSEMLEDSEGEIAEILESIADEALPESALLAEETRHLVGATLSSLPPDYKHALLGKYVHGQSVEEIATASGKGIKATESILHRARLAFAKVFDLLVKKSGGLV